jgi:L-ribulose-5-phosphate 3-epimerase
MNHEKIGIIVALEDLIGSEAAFLSPFGMDLCEIKCWHPENYSDENADKLCTLIDAGSIRVTGLWCGWTGPMKWDLYEGQLLLGLVPSKYRSQRVQELKKGIQFAHQLGLDQVATHVGFIPENPMREDYSEIVSTVRDLAEYASARDIRFNLETGQETAVTLMRFIQDVACTNVGVNLDPANLLLYGRGNPVDAVGIYGNLIHGVHIKDGFYPETGEALGREVPPGEGLVDFPRFLEALNKVGYEGDYIIERELISGDATLGVRDTVAFLKSIQSPDCGSGRLTS